MLISILPQGFLYAQTWVYTLYNLCAQYGWSHGNFAYNDPKQILSLEHQKECQIVFTDFNPDWTDEQINHIHKCYPNAKFIMFSADTIYSAPNANQFAKWKIDLWLDTIESIVSHTTAMRAAQIYWTISQSVIDEIQRNSLELSTIVKDNCCISLCQECQPERLLFFHEVSIRGYRVNRNLNLWEPEKIYKEYARNWFSLGTTTPVWAGRPRSMKGYRDWIAPVCGTLLIYDDYPDIVNNWPVPIYKYLDHDDAINVIKFFKDNPKEYSEALELQREWCYNNTMERQMDRILREVKWL